MNMLAEKELIEFHHMNLMVISIVVAVFASYVAVNLLSRITVHNTKRDKWLLFLSSIVMGGGIWTMHFVDMLSLYLNTQVTYDMSLVILSFILSVTSSAFSFWIVEGAQHRKHSMMISSMVLGAGIVGMH